MDLSEHITQITDPLLKLANAKGTGELLRASLRSVLRDASPRQAEVLRRSAVPRWFDAGVLGVLRESDEGNPRVLEMLRGYSFVRQVGPDRYAYNDQVRDELLREWRDSRNADLRELHLKLYDYFTRLVDTTDGLQITQNAQTKVPAMQAVPMGAWDLWRRESLYHLIHADLTRGMAQIDATIEEFLETGRVADAEALLRITHEVPLDAQSMLTERFLRARVDEAALRLERAAEQFQALLESPELTVALRARVQQALGEVYAEIGQWAHAIALFRSCLSTYQQQNDAGAAADVMLRLGEAYLNLGLNTGGWHVPPSQSSAVRRTLEWLWQWGMGLPFLLLTYMLRPFGVLLPLPHYCAHYQNWLLIRLYRTAYEWFGRACVSFERLEDQGGTMRADQQLARVLGLFGYTAEAIIRLEALLRHPLAEDPYRLAWLQRFLAEARLLHGDVQGARVLIDDAIEVFREVGDKRKEAAALALQGRVAVNAGDGEAALDSYTFSLKFFRELGYVAAREQILYDLRIWNRRLPPYNPLRKDIIALIDTEPEKRYVARFPRSLLPLLQFASLLALPLALLLLALISPYAAFQTLPSLTPQPLSLRVLYDPLRALVTLAVLVPLFMTCYAALGMLIIAILPISQIDNEQPDYIITSDEAIARYDERGTMTQRMAWGSVRRWLGLDRRIWSRPLPLFSRSFLENERGEDLRIDGITGWYTSLQLDIEHRLEGLQLRVERGDLGYAILRSKMGAMAILGALLTLLYAGAENGYSWLPLLQVLGPLPYTIFALIASSGVLLLVPMAYWFVRRPLLLRRELELNNALPWVLAVLGLLPIIAFVISGGTAIPTRSLNFSTLIWGVYVLSEALVTLLIPRRAVLRRVLVTLAVLLTLVATSLPLSQLFLNNYAAAATRLAGIESVRQPDSAAARAAADEAVMAGQAAISSEDAALQLITLGSAQFYDARYWQEQDGSVDRYAQAIATYTQAIEAAPRGSPVQALAYYNRGLAYLYIGDMQRSNADVQQATAICSSPALAGNNSCGGIQLPNSNNAP